MNRIFALQILNGSKKNTLQLIVFFMLFIFCSCNFNQSKIDSVSNKLEELGQGIGEMTEKEFQELTLAMEELDKELIENRSEFTDEQAEEINKLKGKYQAMLFKKGIMNVKDGINDFKQQLEGFVEEITSDSISKKND